MLILEFTQDRIKLLDVARAGQKAVLTHMSKSPVSSLSENEVSDSVSTLMSERGIRKGAPLIISIPRHLFTVRSLKLPAVDEAELRDMAGLQAGKQLPYPADELIWDFSIVEKRSDGYSEISLILGHRNVLDRYIKALKKAGLEADKVILSSEALFGWYMAASGLREEELKGQTKAIIDIDASHIDIVIIRDGVLEFSRSCHVKNDLQEILEEIRKTFYSYEKENSRPIASVVLTGVEEKAAALKPLLAATEGTAKPVEFIHPLKAGSADYREAFSKYLDVSKDASFACALGIAYNLQTLKMDFLPPELKEERQRVGKKNRFVRTAILAGTICLVLIGIFARDYMYRDKDLALLKTRIKETDPKVKRLKEISQQINIVKQNLDMKGSAVDVLREVFAIVPPDVSISVLDFELQKALTIRGISTSMSGVFKFASDLKKSKYFEASEIKYAQKRIIKEKEFVDYEIDCTINRMIK